MRYAIAVRQSIGGGKYDRLMPRSAIVDTIK